MKDERLYLIHIREGIERIEEYTSAGKTAFFAEKIIQDAVARNFEVIGEAAKRLSPPFRDKLPKVPWRRLAGLRDVLIHQYDSVELIEVWNIVERDLPDVKEQIAAILTDLGLAE